MIPIARPRLAVHRGRVYYLFRDEERGSRVSVFTTRRLASGRWKVRDLTDFSVDAWEPSIDMELWKQCHRLHVFVQTSHQGDGERTVAAASTPVYVLEIE